MLKGVFVTIWEIASYKAEILPIIFIVFIDFINRA